MNNLLIPLPRQACTHLFIECLHWMCKRILLLSLYRGAGDTCLLNLVARPVFQTFRMITCTTCSWISQTTAVHFYPRWLCCMWVDEPWTVHCSEVVFYHLLKQNICYLGFLKSIQSKQSLTYQGWLILEKF